MKTILLTSLLLLQQASSHAIFQALWVDGVDKSNTCVRMPSGNSPVTSVSSTAMRCNNARGVSGKCGVAAGGTVTVEMHQQPGDRSCNKEAIGGAHYGPVIVYMSKVADAATADGSSGWFKIYENGWAPATKSTGRADDDFWGVKDMNACCGRVDVKIPSDIPAGDYLLRAEVIALHTAQSANGAQFYMSCYQLTVTGGGSTNYPTVSIPGAYKSSDPGIQVNIHAALSKYVVPGPAVVSGGTTKVPGVGASCKNPKRIRGLNDMFGSY